MKNKLFGRPNAKAVIWSGLIAGAAFLLLEMLMVPLFMGDSPWAPVRMIGAIVLGRDVLPPPATFDAGIFAAAGLLHFALSLTYAFVLSTVITKRSLATSLVIGAVFGLGLYLVNFYGFTAVFPWFAMARNWVSIFAHISFGLVAAGTYNMIEMRVKPREKMEKKEEVKVAERKKEEPVESF